MTDRPVLVLTVGLPGAGKTTVARRLAAELPAVRLTPDDWMKPLFGVSDVDGAREGILGAGREVEGDDDLDGVRGVRGVRGIRMCHGELLVRMTSARQVPGTLAATPAR